jgi:hypothetical protein
VPALAGGVGVREGAGRGLGGMRGGWAEAGVARPRARGGGAGARAAAAPGARVRICGGGGRAQRAHARARAAGRPRRGRRRRRDRLGLIVRARRRRGCGRRRAPPAPTSASLRGGLLDGRLGAAVHCWPGRGVSEGARGAGEGRARGADGVRKRALLFMRIVRGRPVSRTASGGRRAARGARARPPAAPRAAWGAPPPPRPRAPRPAAPVAARGWGRGRAPWVLRRCWLAGRGARRAPRPGPVGGARGAAPARRPPVGRSHGLPRCGAVTPPSLLFS